MKFNKAYVLVLSALTCMGASANDVNSEIALLKKQLALLQSKIEQLEKNQSATKTVDKQVVTTKTEPVVETRVAKNQKSNKDIKLYASLRPTFGYIDEGDNEVFDVRDALSNAGFKSTYAFKDGWKAILHGEWSIDLSNNADFGKARQVYVAVDSPFGQVGIGKQRPVQYTLIAEYADIFDHSNSPYAYDQESPFFVNNLLTYKKTFNNFTWMLAGQFDGENGKDKNDFFNGGLSYDKDNLHVAVTYSTKDIIDEGDVDIGSNNVYAGGVAYTFDNDLYVALAYQSVDYQRDSLADRDGHTFDLSFAYPLGEYYKVKTGVFDFEDGYDSAMSRDHSGANLTFEWLPADSLRFHVEYLYRDFDQMSDFSSISFGFRYDYSQIWNL